MSLAAPFLAFAVLLAACSPAAPTPTPQPTLVASLTPSPAVNAELAARGTLTALAPTFAAQEGTATVYLPTETPFEVTLPPTTGKSAEPPLDISLPGEWKVIANDALILGDVDSVVRALPYVAYRGPITGGSGTILLLWGFPNLSNPFAGPGTPMVFTEDGLPVSAEPDLWSDGLRLLRLAVVEPTCNIGTDQRYTYQLGSLSGEGTQFSAVDCPQQPDTRGWFVGVQQNGLNFVFYAFSDPITAMDTGRAELQAILDTVRFRVPVETPTAAP